MRGWVAVQNESVMKLAEVLNIYTFEAFFRPYPSALLASTGFERFDPLTISVFHVTIYPSAHLNHENLIFKGFHNPAVGIHINPY